MVRFTERTAALLLESDSGSDSFRGRAIVRRGAGLGLTPGPSPLHKRAIAVGEDEGRRARVAQADDRD